MYVNGVLLLNSLLWQFGLSTRYALVGMKHQNEVTMEGIWW